VRGDTVVAFPIRPRNSRNAQVFDIAGSWLPFPSLSRSYHTHPVLVATQSSFLPLRHHQRRPKTIDMSRPDSNVGKNSVWHYRISDRHDTVTGCMTSPCQPKRIPCARQVLTFLHGGFVGSASSAASSSQSRCGSAVLPDDPMMAIFHRALSCSHARTCNSAHTRYHAFHDIDKCTRGSFPQGCWWRLHPARAEMSPYVLDGQ